ncbi:hypothetical protein GCM10010245_36760 [Streptomyces spectabilis]|nr:hypothetical protein GCM10010245_36760 [Streptomyces spectabilis]
MCNGRNSGGAWRGNLLAPLIERQDVDWVLHQEYGLHHFCENALVTAVRAHAFAPKRPINYS